MNSSANLSDNLKRCADLIARAVDADARLLVLPETFAFMGRSLNAQMDIAEQPGQGRIQDFLAEQATRHQIYLVGGTVPVRIKGDPRVYAACLLYDDQGACIATYNKIHLFDVDFPEKGESYRESSVFKSGNEAIVAKTPLGCIGLTICYDLRFPELFRLLVHKGAEIIVLPSAFTKHTGEAHWQLLLRARAVENQAWVIGADQVGVHENGRSTYGHSAIVEPWGRVVTEIQGNAEQVAIAEINRNEQTKLRRSFPCLEHRDIKVSF
ncbi:MAG: carbon-nitrogen hydrolase family protein [Chromatiales bacterium]|nr:carbon-nitrogen hydrolase family protein [Chromatiales bacterium]